jgi:UDP-glucose 4-epimerase
MNDSSLAVLSRSTVLVTGAAGYIGSHIVAELLRLGCQVLALDNYCNSSPEVYARIERLTDANVIRVEADVRDGAALDKWLSQYHIDACVHFAALKSVGESMTNPMDYLDNNVGGLLTLLRVLQKHRTFRFVFSSSATVYGELAQGPTPESASLNAVSVYGKTKLMGEQILQQLTEAPSALEESWHVAVLRYFNPVGAHPSGQIGEIPQGVPSNLMP